ncbi:MAG: DUF4349 domain-containing protein [Chloroflexota bacterium]
MAHTNDSKRRYRLRPIHLVWALLAVMVFSAFGSAVVRNDSSFPSEALVGLGTTEQVLGSRIARAGDAFADADGRALLQAPSAARGELLAIDDVLARDEAAERFAAESEAGNAGDDALIVRTANLELEVDDVAVVLLDARAEVAAMGGYVAGSDEYDQGDRRWASVTYRVPVSRFSDAIDALRGLSLRVNRESTQSLEVTATVVDLDARISNLRASEEALVLIMDRSGRIEDVLAVQMRLEDVRGQIERLDAQRNNLADQATLSTLAVTWFTPVAAVTVAREGWNLGTEVDAALAQTVQALQGVASLGVWATVVLLPLLGLPLLLIVLVLLLLRRRVRSADGGGPDGVVPVGAASSE